MLYWCQVFIILIGMYVYIFFNSPCTIFSPFSIILAELKYLFTSSPKVIATVQFLFTSSYCHKMFSFSAASYEVCCLTDKMCHVSMERSGITTSVCADECIQLKCTVENDDQDPDTVQWRSTGPSGLFFYAEKTLRAYSYRVAVNKQLNNVQYHNDYTMFMRANLSRDIPSENILGFTCQCGQSKQSTTINITGECT